MNINSLAQALVESFLPHIDALLQTGMAGGENVAESLMKAMWSRLGLESGSGKQAATAVAEQPDDQLAVNALIFHVRQMLKDNPGLTRDVEQFLQSSRSSASVVASGTGSIAVGGNMAHTTIIGNIAKSIAEPRAFVDFLSRAEVGDRSADQQRDLDALVTSANNETRTADFQNWAGSDRVTLAIVFTDIVGSTAMGEEVRDEIMDKVRKAHFQQSRVFIEQHKGREIKTIGDSFMVAFKSVDAALDYALALHANTGYPDVRIRAGIHIGPMHIDQGDTFGGAVNFTARVIGAIREAEIWLSDQAKDDIERLGSARHKDLRWQRHNDVQMKGFHGMFTLWSLEK